MVVLCNGCAVRCCAVLIGVRIGDLRDFAYFEERLRNLVTQLQAAHPDLEVGEAFCITKQHQNLCYVV